MAAAAAMQEIIASVDHIKFDLEIAVEQQLGAQPLPFPGMDSERRVREEGEGAMDLAPGPHPPPPSAVVPGRPAPQFGSSSPSVLGLLSPNPGTPTPPSPVIWTKEPLFPDLRPLRASLRLGQDHVPPIK